MKHIVKSLFFIALVLFFLAACNRQQQVQIKELKSRDSSMVKQVEQKDSTIMAYINSINAIQSSIDTLKMQANILRMHGEAKADPGTMIADIRAIGTLILKNNKELAALQARVRSTDKKNQGLVDLMNHLSQELNEKDTEIVAMQQKITRSNTSLNTLVNQYNDSIVVISEQRGEIGRLKTELYTVYYAIGTEKELKQQGVITKQGGVIGIGRVAVLNHNAGTHLFTMADLTNLHEVPLGGHRFVKLVTSHPADSYKITSSSAEKLVITDADAFWSKSKYLVAIVK